MTRILRHGTTLLLALGTSACAARPESGESPYRIVADARQVMNAITVPASSIVFGVGSEEPADDGEWLAVENSALALAESANLLLMPGRAREGAVWTEQSLALVEAARAAAAAARDQNVDAVLTAGDAIYMTCEGCHEVYMGAR